MTKFNRICFWGLIVVIFLALLYKIFRIPVVTDEAITVTYFNFNIWDIMMYKDHYPNNHILNTLLAKFCVAVLATSPL